MAEPFDGITFFRTGDRESVVGFYRDRLGCVVWREQPDCTILHRDGYALGFCAVEPRPTGWVPDEREGEEATRKQPDPVETEGCLTFLHDDRAGVGADYESLADVADGEPRYNESYDIYQFFAEDPEGRTVEVQTFE